MNNTQVGHAFVYGDNGKGSNFESSNGTLWSYGSKLAIKFKGYIVIDNDIATYSNSSQRHASHLNSAIGWGTSAMDRTIHLYGSNTLGNATYKPKATGLDEVGVANKAIKDLLVKQERARSRSYFDEIEARINNTKKIIEVFGIDKRSGAYKEFLTLSDIDDLKNNFAGVIASYKIKEDQRRKREITAQHTRRAKQVIAMTGMSQTDLKKYTKTEVANYDFLYVDDDKLCTTQHICVDLREARVLYKALKAGKSVIGQKIGMYSVLGHNAKAVKIGCHNILMNELERIFNANI